MLVATVAWMIKNKEIRYVYRSTTDSRIAHILLSFVLALMLTLFVLYCPLLYNWDAVSVYIPIAKTIVETGSLVGPNIYYQTSQTMYAPPLTPILTAFFISVVGDWGYRLVPIELSIMMFLVIYDIHKLFTKNPTTLALVSFFTIVTNPFYLLYYIKAPNNLDLGFVVLVLLALYETIKMLVSHALDTKQLLLWAIASALLIASKEYGVYVFIALFVVLIALTTRIRYGAASKVLSTSLLLAPFVSIYLWDTYKLGLSLGVLCKILGSGLLLGIAFWFYRKIPNYFSSMGHVWDANIARNIAILSSITLPMLLYYIVFAMKYGVIGPMNLIWIQQKFIPENVLTLIAPLYTEVKPQYDVKYMNFFAYDRIFRSIGGFVAIGSFLILIPLIYAKRYYQESTNNSLDYTDNKMKLKLLMFLALMIIFYYFGAVDISQTLTIVGTEFRRVLPLIATLNVVIPIVVFVQCKSENTEKLIGIWALSSIILHMGTVDTLGIPHSYLELLNPQKTLVSSDTIAIFFGLLSAFTWLTLILGSRKTSEQHKNTVRHTVKLELLTLLAVIIFTSVTITGFLTNHVSKYSSDPRWYDTIFSSITYNPGWGLQWVKVYEVLKDKQNATILVEGAYPLSYFLNRPVIVYGNPHSIWFTTHALLAPLINGTNSDELYIVRNKNLESNFSKNVFNIVKNILEVDNIMEIRTLTTILSSRGLEVLELKTFKLVYEADYNNVSLFEDKKVTKYRVLANNIVEWNITTEKNAWYILQIILSQPLRLSDQCLLKIELAGDGSGNKYVIELEDDDGNTRYLYTELMNWNTTKTLILPLNITIAKDYPERFNLANVTKIKIAYKLEHKIDLNRVLVKAARFYCPERED